MVLIQHILNWTHPYYPSKKFRVGIIYILYKAYLFALAFCYDSNLYVNEELITFIFMIFIKIINIVLLSVKMMVPCVSLFLDLRNTFDSNSFAKGHYALIRQWYQFSIYISQKQIYATLINSTYINNSRTLRPAFDPLNKMVVSYSRLYTDISRKLS